MFEPMSPWRVPSYKLKRGGVLSAHCLFFNAIWFCLRLTFVKAPMVPGKDAKCINAIRTGSSLIAGSTIAHYSDDQMGAYLAP